MAKVKIVQISRVVLTSEPDEHGRIEHDVDTEYLDSMGRVWYQVRRSKAVEPTEENDYSKTEYWYEWVQKDLPDEPPVA